MDMHKDKVEELKQVLKTKKEAESAQKTADETAALFEEVNHLRKVQQELEQKIAVLEENLKQAQTQAKENEQKFIRLYAEFDNFRKRTNREKDEQIRFSHEQVIKDILPVLDDLDRALSHASSSAEIPILIEGVQLVKKHLMSALEKYGLTPFDSLGEPFDPHVHEAVSHEESSEYPPDSVVTEYRKGYLLHGKLVRPALVAVSKAPESK
jgi:molecular chaperone GrpE